MRICDVTRTGTWRHERLSEPQAHCVFPHLFHAPQRARARDDAHDIAVVVIRVWNDWKQALIFVKPETVIRWQRKRFRERWARLCREGKPGRLFSEKTLLQVDTISHVW
ncbi:hypothetical protein ACFL1X_11280 [Candidatus Hydrogenedentota bacterium]